MTKRIVLFLFFFIFVQQIYAQYSFNLINYTKADGLSDNYIHSIEEDYRGVIWLATSHGINSFNGLEFKSYKKEDSIFSNLVRNDFLSVYEDANNQLWFGGYNGTIYRFNHAYNRFENASLHHVTLQEYPIFTDFYQNKDSELFALSANGLYRYSKFTNNYHKAFREFPLLNNEQVYSMFHDEYGNNWLGTKSKGLVCLSQDSSKKMVVRLPPYTFNNQPQVTSFLSVSDSVLMVGTSHGLYSIKYERFGQFQVERIFEEELAEVFISALSVDQKGNIWIGTSYKGLWVLTQQTVLHQFASNQTDGASIVSVKDIMCDRGGRIWVATHGNGLFLYNPDFSGVHQTDIELGLSHNIVSAIHTDNEKNVWVGTDGGGITVFDSTMNVIQYFNEKSGLSSNSIMNLELDSNYMWVSSWYGGLMKINVENYEIELFTKDNSSLSTNAVKSTCFKDSLLYIGTHEHGVEVLHPKKNKISVPTHIDYGTYYPSVQKYINKIYTDSENKLWVATIRNLYCVDSGKVVEVIANDSHLYPHHPIYITDITETYDNYILAATNKGCFKINIHTYAVQDMSEYIPDITHTKVLSVLSADDSTYWLATQKGLFQYNPQNEESKKIIFTETSSGLFFFERAVFQDANSKIYYGTNEGLFAFYPDEVSQKHTISSLYFSDLYLSYEIEKTGSKILPKHISCIDTLRLPASYTTFSLAFESVCYSSPEAVEYAYKLKGFDETWNYVGKKHDVVFTNLPPGMYELHVKAWQFNKQHAETTSLYIEILPMWWKTWWFKVIAIIVIALVLYGVYYVRLVSLQHQKQLLKKEVDSQTKALKNQNNHIEIQHNELVYVTKKLQESNDVLLLQKEELEDLTKQLQEESTELDELNKSLKQLNETNNQLFSLITHDVKNSFYSIHSLSETLKLEYDDLSLPQRQKIITLISHATLKTADLLENLLYWSKTQSTTIECYPEYCGVNEIIQYVLESYKHVAQEKNIITHYNLEKDYQFYADKEMIVTTIRNIYNNALKYTPEGGLIVISVLDNDDYIHIQIKDSGIGIENEILESLLGKPTQFVKNNKKELHSSGLGLLVSKQFIEKNKGVIDIETEKNKGSTFHVYIPKKPQHINIKSFEVPYETNITAKNQAHSYCIAIIEDNPAILRLFRDFLEHDYMCALFSSPLDFLEALTHETFDMIISDIMMPQLDGISLCKKIKNTAKTAHIPCILISSNQDDDVKRQVYANGADGFLQKPVSKPVLLALVYKLFVLYENYTHKNSLLELPSDKTQENNQFSQKFDEIIKQNISNSEFSVEDMAHSMGMSRTQLFRKVKSLYAISPKDFLIKIRMHAAAELLQYNNSKITEIAYATGFSDPSYFTRCFVKHYNVTPSEYRDSLLRL
ncbi:MAG: two-component regulator propeller domain-containing protein [Bacteroidales bacterium]